MTAFTIVTPSYNQGEFIDQTIKSIWDQEGDFEIEHIVADGGSTDSTLDVIKKLEKSLKEGKYPVRCRAIRFRWWSKKDKGQADAINQGLLAGKGNIFAWLNSDDFYEPGILAKVAAYLDTHPNLGCLYSNMNFVDRDGGNPKSCDYVSDFSFWRLLKYCYIPQPSTFFRREVFEKAGSLNISYRYAFDYDYWLRLAKTGVKIDRADIGTLSNLRTYPERKTEQGLMPMRREVNKIMLSHGYWYAPALLESAWIIAKKMAKSSQN